MKVRAILKNLPLVLLLWTVLSPSAHAQLSISDPGLSNSRIASAADYATEVLQNPWDMSSPEDVSSFIPFADTGAGLSGVSFTNGLYNFTLSNTDAAYFHLLSPGQCSTNPLGRNGQAYPIDSTKYRYLTIRMSTTAASDMRVLWYRGCNYANEWVHTTAIPTLNGWHTYIIDLETIGHQNSKGGDLAWSAAPVTGLRIDPGYSGTVSIDWVTLTAEPPVNGSYDASYSFAPSGADTRHSLFLDNDSNPFNGFMKTLVSDSSSGDSAEIDSTGLFPGSYKVVGVASDDFATLRADPWDMNQSSDVGQKVGISSVSFSSGVFSGSASGDAYFFLNTFSDDIDPSVYRYLCFRLNSSVAGGTFVVWTDGLGGSNLGLFNVLSGDNTYALDLQTIPTSGSAWNSKAWKRLRITLPTGGGSNNFSLYWAALRENGCSSPETTPAPVVSPGSIVVNAPPYLKVLQPDSRGGADFAATVLGNPWNFEDTSDITSYAHMGAAEIYPNNSVGGIQGDFFRGVNTEGNPDPYHPSLEESATSNRRIDTSRFKNLVYRLYIAAEQDVVNGSVARIIWQAAGDGDAVPFNGDDQITFDGWNEYVQDMTKIKLEPILHAPGTFPDPPWHGMVNLFRVDAHEFTPATEFFFDYIRLTADDETDTKFAITYELSDSDDSADDVSVSFYYSTSPSLASPQPIVMNLPMNRNSRVYLWDTSGLAAGTYYVFGVASDGVNDITAAATGRLVKGSSSQNTVAPVLVVNSPTEGKTVYDTMIVKGYAIDDIQTAGVEVLADGELLTAFTPSRFDRAVRAAYPTYAEASNAGFFEQVDASSLSPGAHVIVVRAYDTAGNVTTSPSINVIKAAGNDPALESEPAAENESPLGLVPISSNMGFTMKLNKKTNALTVKVMGGGSCSEIKVVVDPVKSVVMSNPAAAAVLMARAGAASITKKVSKLKGLKRKRNKKDAPVYAAALCNGARRSGVLKLTPSTLTNRKKVKNVGAWITHLRSKF